jgi:putative addiction module killer protein
VVDEVMGVAYRRRVIEVRETETFSVWLSGLRDVRGRAEVARRVRRLALGNAGDAKPVGSGVSELRIHHGPGYRVYFVQRGAVLVILLCGGDKSSQDRDIAAAIRLAKEVR